MMANCWQVVQLGEVVRHRVAFIEIDDATRYKRCRVQTGAKGVVLRDVVAGSDIRTKRQQVCQTDDFLVAEIDAKVGGYGLVGSALGGAIVSSHYFLYETDREKLIPQFLGWFCKTPKFHAQVTAQGSTNYAAIRPGHVLEYRAPLPSLGEQQRIIARLDKAERLVNEALRLRNEVRAGYGALCRKLVAGEAAELVPLREILSLQKPDVTVVPDEEYPFAGVYSFGRGVFAGETKTGNQFGYKVLSKLKSGQFIYPKLMAWEGALGVVPDRCHSRYVSPEFCVFDCDVEKASPEILGVIFSDPSIWPKLHGTSKGTNVRRQRLHPETFLDFRIPVPPPEIQTLIKSMVEKRNSVLNSLEAETELNALIPAMLHEIFGEVEA